MKRSASIKREVLVEVPGTTANLGAGFDCLGLALEISNACRIRRSTASSLTWKGASGAARSMAREAAAAFFRASGRKRFGWTLEVCGRVPIARGLGSSVTVRLGIAAGLNQLSGSPLGREDLLALVARLEGHPDNAAPAVFGGFAVSAMERDGRVRHVRFPVDPALRFILIVPDRQIETKKARRVLPRSYSRADAVHNVARASLMTAALVSKRYDLLWCAVDDRLHQPYRAKLLRPLRPVLQAARKAGALGGWLSGSGSTICLVARRGLPRILCAVKRAMPRSARWTSVVVRANNRGFRIR